MATLKDVKETLSLKPLNGFDEAEPVSGGCACDLLSWVMARGQNGMAWITVQTHLNVIAIACLHEFSCVIFPENVNVPKETVDKATEEGIALFSAEQPAFDIAGRLYSIL